MVNNREARVSAQPVRGLPVCDQVDVAVVRKKLCKRPQTVTQLIIVTKAAFYIAVGCQILLYRSRKAVSRVVPPRAPSRIVAIHPQIHNVDKITVSHKFLQSQTGGRAIGPDLRFLLIYLKLAHEAKEALRVVRDPESKVRNTDHVTRRQQAIDMPHHY